MLLDLLLLGQCVPSVVQCFPQSLVEGLVVQGLGFLLQRSILPKMKFLSLKWWAMDIAHLEEAWSFVTVQVNKVEIHEVRPKVLTEDKGGLVWR